MKLEFRKKSIARLYACQAAYLKGMLPEASAQDLWDACCQDTDEGFDATLFKCLTAHWIEHHEAIQTLLGEHLSERWQSGRLDSVLSAIIQIGISELQISEPSDTPLIISEYVDVGHAFFEDSQTKMIHGILHNAAQKTHTTP